jgi:NAD(P)-dependent dehydrogenase (short-subunit alcohol dehydrogenase family)
MADLDGKVAVITGTGSGMGKAAALLFAKYGAKLVVADISGKQDETAAAIGAAAIPYRCDVSREEDVAALMDAAVKAYGKVDIVCNVAGIGIMGTIDGLDMSHYDKTMDVDVRGVVHGTKHALRVMKPAGGGVILNWASVGAFGGTRNFGVYAAAKAAVVALTQSAAIENAADGIRANVICPGAIFTEMWVNTPPERVKERTKNVPQGRLGTPEEVGELAVFLASDKAGFINGAVLVIDGAQTAQVP